VSGEGGSVDTVQVVITALRHRAEKLKAESVRQPGDRPADEITRQLWGTLATELELLADALAESVREPNGSPQP
jgi:hypothetical protein